jgi:hypothetical protein
MNSKHARTLKAVFAKPVASNIKFADIEAMVIALRIDRTQEKRRSNTKSRKSKNG